MTEIIYCSKMILALLFTGDYHIFKQFGDEGEDYTLQEIIIDRGFNPIYLILLILLIAVIVLIRSETKKNKKIYMYKNYLDKSISILQKTEDITNRLDEIEMRDTNESDN